MFRDVKTVPQIVRIYTFPRSPFAHMLTGNISRLKMREFDIGEMERCACFQGWLCACASVLLDIPYTTEPYPS